MMSNKKNNSRDRLGGFIYQQPPTSDPRRYEIIKYATWRMRLYQELESVSYENLQKKTQSTADQIFPKLIQRTEEKQFFMDFLSEYTDTHDEDLISFFICLMLYSRDLRNHETFIKMEKLILSLRLDRFGNGPAKMFALKDIASKLTNLSVQSLTISREEYSQNEIRITHWYDRTKSDIVN